LKPEAKLCIIYPDKRYCFDHFREAASFRDAYDVYSRGRQETARMVLDFFNTSIDENAECIFWGANNMQKLLSKKDSKGAIEAYEKTLAGEKPDDVHFWPFADYGFLRFLYDCVRAKLIPFSCVQFYPTKENSQQFLVELKYDPTVLENNENELANLADLIGTAPLDYHNSKHLELERKNIELINKLTETENKNISLNQCNAELTDSVQKLAAQYQQLTDAYGGLKTQNIQLNNDIQLLVEKNAELKSRVASLQTIENSTFWRLTKPARLLLDIIKKPFREK
jgi:hypothetical protein